MAAGKSVLLVTVDCLRADHCGFMGYSRPTTPFLDNLAGQSFVFPTAIVAGAPTYYSFPAIMASRYPFGLGREMIGLAAGEMNLASAFKLAGYSTAFFGAANPYLSARFGYDHGFDTFRDSLDGNLTPLSNSDHASANQGNWAGSLNRSLDKISHRLGPLGAAYDELYFQYCQRWTTKPPKSLDALRRFPAADVIVDQARTWLASLGENPFFLWLHFMDPHSPYYPTEKGLEILGEKNVTPLRVRYLNAYWNRSDLGSKRLLRRRENVMAFYDAGICWVDAQVSRLISALRQFNLWENCILALTADHGEEFLEHDGRYHAPFSLVEQLIHVPLLLRVPGAAKKDLPAAPFSLLHLAPTLLDAAALPIPAEFSGDSHWQDIQEGRMESGFAIAECIASCTNPFRPELRRGPRLLAVRGARHKLVLSFEAGTASMFDLKSDPEERKPLSQKAAKPERRQMLQIALEHLKKQSGRRHSTAYLRTRIREIKLSLAAGEPRSNRNRAAAP